MYFKLCLVFIFLRDFGTCQSQICPIGQINSTCAYNRTCQDLMPTISTEPCKKGCSCSGVLNTTTNQCVPIENCCPKGEIYSACGGRCQGTCSRPYPICPFICAPGCVCPGGQVKNESGICVPLEKCVCPPGEVYTYGNRCPPTCFFPNQSCESFAPVHGCYCVDGTIRNDYTNECVQPDTCPQCPKGQEPSHCGSTCQSSCYNKKPDCLNDCQPGCACQAGCVCAGNNVMDTNIGKCVNVKNCSPTQDCPKGTVRDENTGECITQYNCPAGQHHELCGTACPPTCIKPYSVLCMDICINGCFCDNGTILDTSTKECVPPEKCTCPNNMVYNNCGSACPDTCQYQNQSCTKQCIKGCFCPDGTVQDLDTNFCIPKNKCICPKDKIYQCGSSCPPTCIFPKRTCINKKCEPNCFCLNGTILDETTGNCVTPDNCPKCPNGEELSLCGGVCEASCSNPNATCTTDNNSNCQPGCVCASGTVRNANTKKCVTITNCPKK